MIWNTVHFESFAPEKATDISNKIMYRSGPSRHAIFEADSFNSIKNLWMTPQINFGIHGASKSSVLADESTVFVGSDTSWFYAFDKFTGNLKWKFYLGESTRGIHSTAVIEKDFVYVGSYRGSVYKINKYSGALIWMRILGGTVGASPFIEKDDIVFNVETFRPDGYLIKLNKNSGEIVWQSDFLGEQSHSSPALSEDGKTVLVGVNNSTVQAFDYQTGQRKWTTKVLGQIKSTAWIDGPVAYFSNWGKELISIEIETGKIIWQAKLKAASQVSPAFSKKYGLILIADSNGTTYGVHSKSGKIIWQWQKEKFKQSSSPILLKIKRDEFFLLYCQVNKLCMIKPENGLLVKTWDLDGFFTGSLFLEKNKIYFSYNDGPVAAYEFK
ncbi:MAG: PQQ-like beta-propeller repeat protein [Bdellovibrio sp.]|nr:PQQ-like beta-propeller repeat protein [Bdellovibrio sp.]